jgi:hypothetical protein
MLFIRAGNEKDLVRRGKVLFVRLDNTGRGAENILVGRGMDGAISPSSSLYLSDELGMIPRDPLLTGRGEEMVLVGRTAVVTVVHSPTCCLLVALETNFEVPAKVGGAEKDLVNRGTLAYIHVKAITVDLNSFFKLTSTSEYFFGSALILVTTVLEEKQLPIIIVIMFRSCVDDACWIVTNIN